MKGHFEHRGHRFVYVDENGEDQPFPFPGHADAIIDALRAHGDGVKPSEEAKRTRWGTEEVRLELPALDKRPDDAPSWYGSLNGYLIEQGISRGLLVRAEDGSLSLNHELANLHDEFCVWAKARRREAAARRETAREWEAGAGRSE